MKNQEQLVVEFVEFIVKIVFLEEVKKKKEEEVIEW